MISDIYLEQASHSIQDAILELQNHAIACRDQESSVKGLQRRLDECLVAMAILSTELDASKRLDHEGH